MAVVIRMARRGAKKRPFYQIVVADERFPKEGRNIELVGRYNPTVEPAFVELNVERIQHWQSQGARLSPTVASLLKRSTKNEGTD